MHSFKSCLNKAAGWNAIKVPLHPSIWTRRYSAFGRFVDWNLRILEALILVWMEHSSRDVGNLYTNGRISSQIPIRHEVGISLIQWCRFAELSKQGLQFKSPSIFFFIDPSRVGILRDPLCAAVPLRVVVAALLHRPHDHHGLPLRPHGPQGIVYLCQSERLASKDIFKSAKLSTCLQN